MKRAFFLLTVFFASQCAVADGIGCPNGTKPNGEKTPDVSEAWCEDSTHKMHGPYRSWWPSGKLGNEGQYEHGAATGKWRGWYESGELQGEEWFENGEKKSGHYYDKQGHAIPEP